MPTVIPTFISTLVNVDTHARKHARAHTHARAHIHTHTHMRAHTHNYARAHPSTQMNVHTHAQPCTHANTHILILIACFFLRLYDYFASYSPLLQDHPGCRTWSVYVRTSVRCRSHPPPRVAKTSPGRRLFPASRDLSYGDPKQGIHIYREFHRRS